SSFTASLDLGTFFAIQGLQARLYSGSPLAAGTNLANNPSLVQKWSQSQTNPNPVATGSGTFNMINTGLSAGTYTLEVRGQVTGTAGG
ncbi:hypothetical protein, partial [Klebsiella pneumoniae]|uniref:hypothetical protein n=1 Tax=Klebsiella pneumoniae TaxID=573 RepID=UPI002730C74A